MRCEANKDVTKKNLHTPVHVLTCVWTMAMKVESKSEKNKENGGKKTKPSEYGSLNENI